jgi:hypothetical protein
MELSIDAELYYISGVDQIKNYNESATFCGEWGGQLISDAKVVSRLGNVSSAYWVESGENATLCNDLSQAVVNSNKSCGVEKQFICKKADEVEIALMAEKRSERTNLVLAIVLPIVILLIVVGAIFACKFWHKEANTISIKKLPTETPIGSPRSGVQEADKADERKKEKVKLVKSNANDITEQD